jgi:hypothetical protein
LNLLASGSSIEDVYARATDYLDFYLNSALKYETKIANMSTYAEIQALNPLGVICWGKKAQRSMEKILGTNSNLKIVGIPHPSAMNTACWKRNYPNDCDGTENSVVEKASEIILTNIRNNP